MLEVVITAPLAVALVLLFAMTCNKQANEAARARRDRKLFDWHTQPDIARHLKQTATS